MVGSLPDCNSNLPSTNPTADLCSKASFSPTQIFDEGTTEEKGENARLSAFVGAIAVGDLVKSTLGPKGMDKILQSAYVVLSGILLVFFPLLCSRLTVNPFGQIDRRYHGYE